MVAGVINDQNPRFGTTCPDSGVHFVLWKLECMTESPILIPRSSHAPPLSSSTAKEGLGDWMMLSDWGLALAAMYSIRPCSLMNSRSSGIKVFFIHMVGCGL